MNRTRHATSTSSDRVGLDHVGFIVDDLEEARALFAALGFTLTPRADHTRRNAAGEVIPAGSSQHSAMFDDGYIELMQITDPDAGHQLTPAMRERFGLHVVAFGTSDAPVCHAARQRAGLSVGAVMDWSRPVKTAERAMVLDPLQAPSINDIDIVPGDGKGLAGGLWFYRVAAVMAPNDADNPGGETLDRKSTRLNSSHRT